MAGVNTMNTFQLHSSTGKGKIAQVDFWAEKAVIIVSVEDFNYPIEDANRQTTYHIATPTGGLLSKHYKKLFSYKNANGALKYAQKHGVEQYRKTNEPSSTPCPAPAPAPAKSAAKGQGILFIEVEVAGRGKDAEIIEISVVNSAENVLLHSRVRPSKPHKNVSMSAPSFDELWKSLTDVIGRSDIAFYNAKYSERMILQSIAKAFDTPIPKHFYTLFPHNTIICVGERYEKFNNYRLGYFRNYGLQHINSACGQSALFWRDVNSTSSGTAIKSARLYNYLNHKELAA